MPRYATKFTIDALELELVHYCGPEDSAYLLYANNTMVASSDAYSPLATSFDDNVMVSMALRIIELEKEKNNDN